MIIFFDNLAAVPSYFTESRLLYPSIFLGLCFPGGVAAWKTQRTPFLVDDWLKMKENTTRVLKRS
jgi:hypothetical protein